MAMRRSPAGEGEVDGGAGGEVTWAVQGAAPSCRGKGELITAFPTPSLCSLLEKPPSTQAAPAGPSLPPQDIGVIRGDAQPSLSTPLTRWHRERRERTREGRRGRPHHQALPVAASATGEGKRKGDSFGKAKHRQGWWGSDTCGLLAGSALVLLGWQRGDTAAVTASITDLCPREDHVPGEMLLEKGWQR